MKPAASRWGVALLAAGALISGAWLVRERSELPPALLSSDEPAHDDPAATAPAAAPPGAAPRVRVSPSEAEAEPEVAEFATSSPALPEASVLAGVVVDPGGRPLEGLSIRYARTLAAPGDDDDDDEAPALATSDARGEFTVPLERRDGHLLADGPHHATLAALDVRTASSPAAIVACATVELEGTVVDERRTAVAGATVELVVPAETFAAYPHATDDLLVLRFAATTDTAGHFQMLVPCAPAARLRTSAPGYRADERAFACAAEVAIVLAGESPARRLQGVVLHADGAVAPGARVMLGRHETVTDATGRFELDLPERLSPHVGLAALLEGFQPAFLPGFAAALAPGVQPEPVELRLGGPELAIAGRVEGPDGAPQAGWHVALQDGSVLDDGQTPPMLLEAPVFSGVHATTGEDGRFTLSGLQARTYDLLFWSPRTLASTRRPAVPAGTRDLVVRVEQSLRPRLAGRVVGRDGLPIAHVDVAPTLTTGAEPQARLLAPSPEKSGVLGGAWATAAGTRTDAEGRFELHDVPPLVRLLVSGDAVVPVRVELPTGAADSDAEVEIEVARRVRFRLRGGDGRGLVRLLDEAGEPLSIFALQADQWSIAPAWSIPQGSSVVLAVSEDARTLEILRAGDSPEQRAFAPEPGALTTIEL